jgi:hypothetical protein
MAVRTLYGRINANGIKENGSSGYTTSKIGEGQYLIDFTPDFGSTPTVVATPLGNTPKGTQTDNIINIHANKSNCILWMFDLPDGIQQDGDFNFIAIGE